MPSLTNAERSSATRAALLDATIKAIVIYGYTGATSVRIAELSGLTRGAQVHHFKNKPALVVESLVHLLARRMELWQDDTPDTTLEQVIEDIWRSIVGDDQESAVAGAELLTAARTDEQLKAALVPAERAIIERIRNHLRKHFTGRIPPERMDAILGLTVSAIRGIAMHEAFDPNEERSKAERAELVRALLALSGEGQEGYQVANAGSTA